MQAVILAGGFGTRLRPITESIPKPLVPVQGRTLIENVLDILKKYNILKVTICVGYLGDMVKDHLGDGSRFGMQFDYTQEDEPRGSGGCLKMITRPTEPFFLMNADNLFNVDLMAAYRAHKTSGALVTLFCNEIPDPWNHGVIKFDGDKVVGFVFKPKPEESPSNCVHSGYSIIDPSVLDLIPDNTFCSIEKEIFSKLAPEGKINSFKGTGQWFPTDTIEAWQRVCKEWVPVR